jgi:hypothetical protein
MATYSGICQRVNNDTRCQAWNDACASPGVSTWAWCQPYTAPAPAVAATPTATAPTKQGSPVAASAGFVSVNVAVLAVAALLAIFAL